MSSASKGTKFLPVMLLVIVGAIGGAIYFFSQFGVDNGQGGRTVLDLKTGRVKTVTVDADNASDTLDKIAINSADIKDKFKGVDETIYEQQKQMREMAQTLKEMNQTNRALKEQLEQQNRKMASMEDAVSSGTTTIDAESIKASIMAGLKENFSELMPKNTVPVEKNPATEEGEYQLGEEKPVEKKPVHQKATRSIIRSFNLPVDQNGVIKPAYLKSLEQSRSDTDADSSIATTEGAQQRGNNEERAVRVDPRFTIPPDSALFDSVTITALVGRIPRDGEVNDPSPFKVAIGRENLAANGFSMPGIRGMIMSGYVYGDAVRRCVRTKIRRATYIFEDGRILTLPKLESRRDSRIIGYLADDQGDPCIKGKYYTNGNAQVTKSILANMAAGAANAYAETQTTTQSNSFGGTTKAVTGDNKKYVMGSAVASGANSVATLLANQRFDQWDQVVVGVGKTVTIHIDEQLEIDNASNLRKVSYENENASFGFTD